MYVLVSWKQRVCSWVKCTSTQASTSKNVQKSCWCCLTIWFWHWREATKSKSLFNCCHHTKSMQMQRQSLKCFGIAKYLMCQPLSSALAGSALGLSYVFGKIRLARKSLVDKGASTAIEAWKSLFWSLAQDHLNKFKEGRAQEWQMCCLVGFEMSSVSRDLQIFPLPTTALLLQDLRDPKKISWEVAPPWSRSPGQHHHPEWKWRIPPRVREPSQQV